VGSSAGIEVADLVHAITAATGLDGEAVRDVKLFRRFALLSVPRSDVARVIRAVDGSAVGSARLSLEPTRS
jgi:hypothetical protein